MLEVYDKLLEYFLTVDSTFYFQQCETFVKNKQKSQFQGSNEMRFYIFIH